MKSRDWWYVREKMCGKYTETEEVVWSYAEKEIERGKRGGKDNHKVYAS